MAGSSAPKEEVSRMVQVVLGMVCVPRVSPDSSENVRVIDWAAAGVISAREERTSAQANQALDKRDFVGGATDSERDEGDEAPGPGRAKSIRGIRCELSSGRVSECCCGVRVLFAQEVKGGRVRRPALYRQRPKKEGKGVQAGRRREW